jgi:hypothetical protein
MTICDIIMSWQKPSYRVMKSRMDLPLRIYGMDGGEKFGDQPTSKKTVVAPCMIGTASNAIPLSLLA